MKGDDGDGKSLIRRIYVCVRADSRYTGNIGFSVTFVTLAEQLATAAH
jgi:hypothetical protein